MQGVCRDVQGVCRVVPGRLQAGESHEQAAHGECAGPADALEGVAGAKTGERTEGHGACAQRRPNALSAAPSGHATLSPLPA